VHSGPAASAIGAHFLSGTDKALVIDIGGTTTDLAVVDGGQVNVREEGTNVGPYHTAVRAAHVRSIGLGGDSYLGLDAESRLTVGPARVVPISYLAYAYPQVLADLEGLDYRVRRRPSPDHIEYWFLQREPRRFLSNQRARQVVEMLRAGPIALPVLLERLGLIHPLQFDGRSLVEQGVIGRAALTPTDLLHLTGAYAPWSQEAAASAADLVARLSKQSVASLIARTWTIMSERIVAEVVVFLSGQTLERVPAYVGADDLGLWLFEESLYGQDPYLGATVQLKIPIVGIGAPAAIFLPRVAELLGTELILPPHYGVANAVGAVAGSVMVSREAWVLPHVRAMEVRGYYVQSGSKQARFARLETALAYARETLGTAVRAEAQAAGAAATEVTFEQLADGAETYRIRARAVGNPKMGDEG
jgi:N-methylhydantoinase A/oxoprolinase/acetone carboxylase beta subunit